VELRVERHFPICLHGYPSSRAVDAVRIRNIRSLLRNPGYAHTAVSNMMFRDRQQAGKALGSELARYGFGRDVVVLGLPRGGVPVALEVAKALRAPLDVLVVRKLGLPEQPELAVGAIAYGGLTVYNDSLLAALGL